LWEERAVAFAEHRFFHGGVDAGCALAEQVVHPQSDIQFREWRFESAGVDGRVIETGVFDGLLNQCLLSSEESPAR
jgi:hypothetical protein